MPAYGVVMVAVVRGTAYIPVVNVGATDATLHLRTPLGTLSLAEIVSLPKDITEVTAPPKDQVMAPVSSQVSSETPLVDPIQAVELSGLLPPEQDKVRSLLRQYETVFSTHDGDLRCTNLIEHEIPLLDEVPVWQRFRGKPPSEYEAVSLILGSC